jgi:myo-inositol-1(or 4)-monophosphatase
MMPPHAVAVAERMTTARDLDRDTVWRFLEELAAVAARETLPRFRQPMSVVDKGRPGAFDPVTAADRATEAALRAAITARFPDHGIQGEEAAEKAGTGAWCWIIDPIDGTRSFMSGMPTWGTLVGLLQHGVPAYGMMSQPYVGDCFLGGGGKAALLARGGVTPLRCRAGVRLADATLFATTPDMFAPGPEQDAFAALSARVRLTRFGADCYAYCLLAAGHVDLVVEAGLGFYDIAPLVPIIEGAGGIVSDWQGQPLSSGGRALAAADPALHAAALAVLVEAGVQ